MFFDGVKERKIKIRTGILFETITTLIVTVITIVYYTYRSHTDAIIEQSEITMQRGAETLQKQIYQTLKDAESLVEIYAPIMQTSPLDETLVKIKGITSSLTHSLINYPSITSLYFGSQKGCFFEISTPLRTESHLKSVGIKTPEEGTISIVKIINHKYNNDLDKKKENASGNDSKDASKNVNFQQPESPKEEETNEVWSFLDERFNASSQVGQKTKYDHRKRDWYKNTIITEKATWSDIYIFTSTLQNEAGITVSKTMYKGSIPIGVFSADLTVTTFSEFLEKTKISPNSNAFIINEKDELIANSSKLNNVVNINGTMGLIKIEELKDSILIEAYKKFKENKGKEPIVFFSYNGVEYIASFQDFPRIFTSNWKAVVISPMEDFVGKVSESKNKILIFSLCVIIFAIFMSFSLAQRIAKPIIKLNQEARNIKELKLSENVKIESRIKEIQNLAESMMSLKTSMLAFSYYIPRRLVQKLLQKKGAIHVGGRAKEITMMFSDIENFTNISEKISAENLVYHLSEYFEEMTKILIDHDGTVDKFIGDAIMAFWGAPIPDRNHAVNACQAALLCQKKLKQQNLIWKKGEKPVFPTRIGIHTGVAVVGNIGSSERMNYTAIGDNINFASRLEGLNKYYGTNILISEAVYDKIKGKFLVRSLDKIAVKGKNKAIRIYELVGQFHGEDSLLPDEIQEEFVHTFEKAYHLYLTRQFKEALDSFLFIDEHVRVADKSVRVYIDRCQEYMKNPPHNDWDGSYKLDVKY